MEHSKLFVLQYDKLDIYLRKRLDGTCQPEAAVVAGLDIVVHTVHGLCHSAQHSRWIVPCCHCFMNFPAGMMKV
jgi:hypothetical protein